MPAVFQRIDKIRPAYDTIYRVMPFLCKLLLVMNILIMTMVVVGRYIPFIPDPAQNEEVVLICMSYMAVLLATLAIRRGAHIRMTTSDRYLPPKLVRNPSIVANLAVLVPVVATIMVGWKYATGIGAKGAYVNMPKTSRFWMYFPVPSAGVAMLVFKVEALYNHIKNFFVKERIE